MILLLLLILHKDLRDLLNTPLRLFNEKHIIHIFHCFLTNKYNLFSQNLYHSITRMLAAFVTEEKVPKEVYDNLVKHTLPLIQSFCVYIWGNAQISFETFKELTDEFAIECDSFKNQVIGISAFIELCIIKKLKDVIHKFTPFKGTYHMINPLGFSNMPVYSSEEESILRTSQKHCDLLIVEKGMKFYIDIKTFVTFNSEQCRFSLFHANKASLLQYISNMSVAVKNYIDKNKLTDNEHPIAILYNQLEQLKAVKPKDHTIEQLNKKFLSMLTLIVQAFIDSNLQDLKLSFAVDAGKALDYIDFYNNIVVPHLDKLEYDKTIIDKLLPKKSQINNQEHITTVKQVIEQILPNEMKKDALNYVENIIIPKIKE